jgi:hypothetical protein
VESTTLHVSVLGHDSEVGLDGGVDNNFGLGLNLSLLLVPDEAVAFHEGVVELDVSETLVLGLGHKADCTEDGQIDCARHLDFVVAPSEFKISNAFGERARSE